MRCSIGMACAAALFIRMSLLAPGRGLAAEPDPRFKAFFEAADPAARQMAIAAILAAAPGPMEVERALREGRRVSGRHQEGMAGPANLGNRPVHAANGGVDPLYPSVLQKMFIDQLKEQGARITWTDYPASGHDGSYMEQEDPKVTQFLLKTVRDSAPKHLVWETASPKVGRCDWVRIEEVRDVGNN